MVLVVVAFALFVLVEAYLRTRTARPVSALDAHAREGTVTVAIPAKGMGKVQFIAHGKRVSRPARTSDGKALAAGRSVLVVSLRRHVAVVEPLPVR